jgi:hypothetical protein
MSDVEIVMRTAQGLEPRFRELQKNQILLADSMQKLATDASKLDYLRDELDKATGRWSSLKK